MPSIFTNNLSDLNLFPETFIPSGTLPSTPGYTFTEVANGARYSLAQTATDADYFNINPVLTVTGAGLSVNSAGVLSGTIETLSFRSDNRGEIGIIDNLNIPGPDLSRLILERLNGDPTTGTRFLQLIAGEFQDLTLTSQSNSVRNDGFFAFIDAFRLQGGSDTFSVGSTVLPSVSVDGGTGKDTLDLSDLEAGFSLNLETEELTNGTTTLEVRRFEEVWGNRFLNEYVGSSKAEALDAAGGNDTISAGGGDDSVRSGSGADSIDGGQGNDSIDAGRGNDLIAGGAQGDWATGAAGRDTLWGNDGFDTLWGGADNDLLHGENGRDHLYGQAGADTLTGGENNDTLEGGNGRDSLLGGRGDDLIKGGDGDDFMRGQQGQDRLNGNSGNDRIYGGTKNDTIAGGAGEDTISGGSGNDVLFGGSDGDRFVFTSGHGSDVIRDFDVTEDSLRVEAAVLAGQSLAAALNGARVEADGVRIGFESGSEIFLEGLTSIDGLESLVILF